jgi:tetratricopeptide (TPR) repeat protein
VGKFARYNKCVDKQVFYIPFMNSGLDIQTCRKTLAKKPKSLIFARLADELRASSSGAKDKLDDALEIAEKGLLANPDSLQGRLVHGRILYEKGDFSGAKVDFEIVAEKDPFCLSAHKLLLDTLGKLGKKPETDIHALILHNFEPESVKLQPAKPKAEPEPVKQEPVEIKPAKLQPAKQELSINSALDALLEEEDNMETKLRETLLKVFKKIFGNLSAPPAAPAPPPATPATPAPPAPTPEAKPVEPAPASHEELPPFTSSLEPSNEPFLEHTASFTPAPSEHLPELELTPTSLAELPALEPYVEPAPTPPPSPPPQPPPPIPNLDDLIKEQLADKIDNAPDLTKDIDALLTSAPPVAEEEPELVPYVPPAPAAPQAPDLDALIKEQLADKIDNAPDLTTDIDALLTSAPPVAEEEPELVPYVAPAAPQAPQAPKAPDLDALIKEQLSDKIDNAPDLTTDIDALLASAPPQAAEEPELVPYVAPPTPAKAPDLDALIKEQLSDKIDNAPDLTKDIDALLASAPPEQANAFAENPTPTLAELYMSQHLPQQAAEVYKELLARDPSNVDLQIKLAQAEAQA